MNQTRTKSAISSELKDVLTRLVSRAAAASIHQAMGISGTSGKPLRVRKKQQENGLGKNTDLGVREKSSTSIPSSAASDSLVDGGISRPPLGGFGRVSARIQGQGPGCCCVA